MAISGLDLVEDVVAVGDVSLSLRRPRSAEALLDEHAFEQGEFLPYWAELWPSALALADGLAGLAPAGARVLELGCGLGVPALVAAALGARVTATDWSPAAVELLQANAERNGLVLDARRWDWTDDPAALGADRWPLVLGADVLYEVRNGPQLLAALPGLVAQEGSALIADPGRQLATPFFEQAVPDWTIEPVQHDGPPQVLIRRLTPRTATAIRARA